MTKLQKNTALKYDQAGQPKMVKTSKQYELLKFLAEKVLVPTIARRNDMSSSAVAAAIGVSRSSIMRLLKKLDVTGMDWTDALTLDERIQIIGDTLTFNQANNLNRWARAQVKIPDKERKHGISKGSVRNTERKKAVASASAKQAAAMARLENDFDQSDSDLAAQSKKDDDPQASTETSDQK